MAPTIQLGTVPIVRVKLGTMPISQVKLGTTSVYTPGNLYDGFNISGMLVNWVHELFGDDTAISDGLTSIISQTGENIANIVMFLDATSDYLGGLRSSTVATVRDDICGALQSIGGQLSSNVTGIENGVMGFINGLPVVAHEAIDFIKSIDGATINQIIGTIPVLGNLAIEIGLIPNADGTRVDLKNFLIDALGNVIGTLTCDASYTPNEGDSTIIQFAIGSTDGQGARLLIPDGLMSLIKQTQQVRFNVPHLSDDGILETLVSSVGSPGFVTQLFRRYSNDGSGLNGVGIQLENSVASLVARIDGTVTQVTDEVSFKVGDTFQAVQNGIHHALYQNGQPTAVASWDDTGVTAASGADNRSIGMIMEGAKEMLGSRLFSPTLAYMRAS